MALLDTDGDNSKLPKKFRSPLRCSVKETQPHFLLTDGSFFISAYFTAQSYKQFREKNNDLRVIDLKDVMVVVNQWSVELVYS